MNETTRLKHAYIDGGQLLELPYASGELVMDVVLPQRDDGLPRLERQLVDGALPAWLQRLGNDRVLVDVWLPRFHASSSFPLAQTLSALGMRLPFDRAHADFSGFGGTPRPFISAAVHEAVIDVDE